jgi:hypothetical protein
MQPGWTVSAWRCSRFKKPDHIIFESVRASFSPRGYPIFAHRCTEPSSNSPAGEQLVGKTQKKMANCMRYPPRAFACPAQALTSNYSTLIKPSNSTRVHSLELRTMQHRSQYDVHLVPVSIHRRGDIHHLRRPLRHAIQRRAERHDLFLHHHTRRRPGMRLF